MQLSLASLAVAASLLPSFALADGCHRNNCLRAMLNPTRTAEASSFCSSYTGGGWDAPLPTFATQQCMGDSGKISSACSCAATITDVPSACAASSAVETSSSSLPPEPLPSCGPTTPCCQPTIINGNFTGPNLDGWKMSALDAGMCFWAGSSLHIQSLSDITINKRAVCNMEQVVSLCEGEADKTYVLEVGTEHEMGDVEDCHAWIEVEYYPYTGVQDRVFRVNTGKLDGKLRYEMPELRGGRDVYFNFYFYCATFDNSPSGSFVNYVSLTQE